MKYIELTKGKRAMVDDDDFEFINQWKWYYTVHGYAARNSVSVKNNKRYTIWMHREILNTPDKKLTDHVNRNKLDNRKENLRIANKSQNGINRNKFMNTTSPYKGVSFHKKSGNWQARITLNGKIIYLGLYKTAQNAAKIWNEAAKKYHGKFAVLNQITWERKNG